MDFLYYLVILVLVVTGLCCLVSKFYEILATDYHLTPEQRREAKNTKFCVIGCGVSGICVVEGCKFDQK